MTTEEEPQVYAGILKGKTEGGRGINLEIEIRKIDKNFPTKVFGIPAEEAAQLKPGQAYNFMLVRGGLRRGKDGSWPNHYFYNFKGIATGVSAYMDQPGPSRPRQEWSARDPREQSIERQVALKEARLMAEHFIGSLPLEIKAEYVEGIASAREFYLTQVSWFYERLTDLLNAARHGDGPEEAPLGPPQDPTGAPALPQGPYATQKETSEKVKGYGDLWNRGLGLGYKNKAEMFTVLKIKNDAEVKDLDGALVKLQAHMSKEG